MTEEQIKQFALVLQNNIGNHLTVELANGLLLALKNTMAVEEGAGEAHPD